MCICRIVTAPASLAPVLLQNIINWSVRAPCLIKPCTPRAQGQEPIAMARLAHARKEGGWVLLQNIHLTIDWTAGPLEKAVDKLSEGSHPDFRWAPALSSTPLQPLPQDRTNSG